MNEENKDKPKYTYEQLSNKYLEKTPNNNDKHKVKEFASDYQMIVSFLVTIIILTSLGVFLGYKLDKKLNTTPLFIIIFTFLGIAASYRNLFKDAFRKK